MHSDLKRGKTPTDGLGPLANLPSVIASEFADWEPEWFRAQSAKGTAPSSSGSHPSPVEMRYLQAVVSCPGQPSSVYAKLAGISARKALQVRKRLVELGCIREHVVNAAGRGRPSILLEPTAQAQKTLDGASEAEKKQ